MVANDCVIPVGFGVGNHQLFVINFITAMLVGSGLHAIICPALLRLKTKIEGCAQRYNKTLQRNIFQHCLLERMVAMASSAKPKEATSKKLNKLDKEGGTCMKHTKKKCRRLKLGRILFSPEALLWIQQCQVYPSLQQWHARKIWDWGNLKCTACQSQINALFQLSVKDIKLHLKICKEKCGYFCKHGKWHRRQHLNQCLKAAQEREDKVTERQILAIIQLEKDRTFWHRLNVAFGKHIRGRSVQAVQVEDGFGRVLDFDTKDSVQEAIFN
jgi:hypothetical protein